MKLKKYRTIIITLLSPFSFFLCANSFAQNLESIGEGPAVSVSGGLNINQVFYTAEGVANRRDPYNYFVSGNLNFSIYGWSVPFSFSYSDQNTSFQQPFNQFGISPTFRNTTAYLGFNSMTFSRYTLSGHIFLGGGVETQVSDKLRISMMYGRLQKAAALDTAQMLNIPAYRRMGGGAKVTYGSVKDFLELTLFHARDDSTSIGGTDGISPEENLVLGLGFGFSPIKGLTFTGEVATSALTLDTRSESVQGEGFIDLLMTARASTSIYQAWNGTAQYQFSEYVFGVNYERVDPGYRTHGAYFFNNDLENISLLHRSSWIQKKLNLNFRLGMQKNNLENTELSTMRRLSWSGAVNYQISPKITTQFNFSDFNTFVNFRPLVEVIDQSTPYDNLDTLNYHQLARQASSNVNIVLDETPESRQNLNINFSYQETTEDRMTDAQYADTRFYNLNTAYLLNLGESGWSFSLAGNVNVTQAQSDHLIIGPSASVRRRLLEGKLTTNLTFSFNQSTVDGDTAGRIYNFRAGGSYAVKAHQFTLNVTAIDRFSPGRDVGQHYTELVGELGYYYSFGG